MTELGEPGVEAIQRGVGEPEEEEIPREVGEQAMWPEGVRWGVRGWEAVD